MTPTELRVVQGIAAGGLHTVAPEADGTVACWRADLSAAESTQNSLGQSMAPAGLSGVVQVDAGFHHTLALKGNGTDVC